MIKQKLQQLFMLQLLLGFCKTNQATVDLIEIFKSGVTSVTNLVNQILTLLGSQSKSVAGGGSQKEKQRNALNLITFTIINVVKGYALSIGDQNLATEMGMSLSGIRKISDKKIDAIVKDWLLQVMPLVRDLTPWGITVNSIQSWEKARENYNDAYLLPATKRKNRVNQSEEMYALLSEAMQVCKSTLDTSINSYIELGETKFVAQYKTFRKQTPIPGQHTRIDAILTNELGEPCINCTTTVDSFTKNGKTFPVVSAFTDINGNCTVKEFEPGMRTVTVSGDKIQTKTFGPYQFEKGKAIQQVFVCTPSFQNIPAAQQEKELAGK